MIEKAVAFKRALPKWPQLLITGEPVTREQAKEIIFRTDTFFSDLTKYAGGNNKPWNNWAFKELGFDKLFEIETMVYSKDAIEGLGWELFNQRDQIREKLGFITTSFITNNWASCSYVYGPHGWCSPTGQICHVDNIGKHPSVETVFEDLELIAKEFPFLKMTATLKSGEHCERDAVPVVTFVVRNGSVTMTDEHEIHHFPVDFPSRNGFQLVQSEQGLPDEWILDFGKKTKPVVKRAVAHLKAYIKKQKL